MHCTKCGAKNQTDAAFCYKCGAKIANNPMAGGNVKWYTRLITLIILAALVVVMCEAVAIVGTMYGLDAWPALGQPTPSSQPTQWIPTVPSEIVHFEQITPTPTDWPIVSFENEGTICFWKAGAKIGATIQVPCCESGCTRVYERIGYMQVYGSHITFHSHFVVQRVEAGRICPADDRGGGFVNFEIDEFTEGTYDVIYGTRKIGTIVTSQLDDVATCLHE